MSRRLIVITMFILLAGCQRSDVQNCVDAHLEAFDKGNSDFAEQNEDRANFKARMYITCGQAMVRR